jgi:hypothetical protein
MISYQSSAHKTFNICSVLLILCFFANLQQYNVASWDALVTSRFGAQYQQQQQYQQPPGQQHMHQQQQQQGQGQQWQSQQHQQQPQVHYAQQQPPVVYAQPVYEK